MTPKIPKGSPRVSNKKKTLTIVPQLVTSFVGLFLVKVESNLHFVVLRNHACTPRIVSQVGIIGMYSV